MKQLEVLFKESAEAQKNIIKENDDNDNKIVKDNQDKQRN